MKILITGGAGFIGSHLAEEFYSLNDVTIVDNFSTGSMNNLEGLKDKNQIKILPYDCLNLDQMISACKDIEVLYHFAANPEVKISKESDISTTFKQNVVATQNVLEAARICEVNKIVFASTSTIYGEPSLIPTPENYGPLKPISIYGATKLACEALITAHCSSFKKDGIILRLANIIGSRSDHGILVDFL